MPAPADNILKNFNLFIDGSGYAGNVDQLQPPKLELKTEEHRTGGMDAPVEIDMGMNKLEMSFDLTKYDSFVLGCFGSTTKSDGSARTYMLKGAVQKLGGAVEQVLIKCNGLVKTAEHPAWKAGDKAILKVSIALTHYEYWQNGVLIHLIDPVNMIRIINGIDQLAAIRAAIS